MLLPLLHDYRPFLHNTTTVPPHINEPNVHPHCPPKAFHLDAAPYTPLDETKPPDPNAIAWYRLDQHKLGETAVGRPDLPTLTAIVGAAGFPPEPSGVPSAPILLFDYATRTFFGTEELGGVLKAGNGRRIGMWRPNTGLEDLAVSLESVASPMLASSSDAPTSSASSGGRPPLSTSSPSPTLRLLEFILTKRTVQCVEHLAYHLGAHPLAARPRNSTGGDGNKPGTVWSRRM